MKKQIFLISVLLGFNVVLAKEKKTSFLSKNPKAMSQQTALVAKQTAPVAAQSATAKQPSSLSTDVRFGDQSVGGKYQLPMEALSVVENEKSIDDLIGVRKNFRDRIDRTKGMR